MVNICISNEYYENCISTEYYENYISRILNNLYFYIIAYYNEIFISFGICIIVLFTIKKFKQLIIRYQQFKEYQKKIEEITKNNENNISKLNNEIKEQKRNFENSISNLNNEIKEQKRNFENSISKLNNDLVINYEELKEYKKLINQLAINNQNSILNLNNKYSKLNDKHTKLLIKILESNIITLDFDEEIFYNNYKTYDGIKLINKFKICEKFSCFLFTELNCEDLLYFINKCGEIKNEEYKNQIPMDKWLTWSKCWVLQQYTNKFEYKTLNSLEQNKYLKKIKYIIENIEIDTNCDPAYKDKYKIFDQNFQNDIKNSL